jgi:large subunit ribosomal protein L21
MYAIVEIAGQQFKVEKDQKIYVHRLENEEGSEVKCDQVLLIDNDKNVIVGEPVVKDALVTAKVISHMKGDKVNVFKKKRRKGYKVLNGHRQYFTELQIADIIEKAAKTNAKKAVVKEEKEVKPASEKEAPKTEKKAPAAKKEAPKAEAKKPAAKKATAKKTEDKKDDKE